MDKNNEYMKLKDAIAIAKEQRIEVTNSVVRKMINEGKIPCRRTSPIGKAWIYIRPNDILDFYKKM